MSDGPTWLVLVYRVPGEPSRLRATIWRQLKTAGAVYLANSVAALPESSAAERVLRRLRAEVAEMGGSAQLLRAEALVGQAEVIAAFNTARNAEYAEVVSRCEDFLAEIDKETRAGKIYLRRTGGERGGPDQAARLAGQDPRPGHSGRRSRAGGDLGSIDLRGGTGHLRRTGVHSRHQRITPLPGGLDDARSEPGRYRRTVAKPARNEPLE